MKATAWLQAFRNKAIVHYWAPLRLEANGHVAILRVSADALRVERNGERVRETAGAYAYQQIADVMGALMPTAKIVEERHRQASVKLEPMVAPLIKPGGTVGTVRPLEASHAIDKAIQTAENVTPGDWLVSNVGKHFVLDRNCTDKVAINHGFVVPTRVCRNGAWRGTPTVESVALGPDWRVIQRRGAAHGFGLAADQDDYSQTVVLVDDVCELDGIEYPTAKLYTDPELAALVTHDGRPLPWSRHPNVPVAALDAPQAEAKPAPSVIHTPVPPTPVSPGVSPPAKPRFIPAERTPATPEQVYAALAKAWKEKFATDASRASLCVLLAQWALETGRGKAMWNFNIGNQKGKIDGSDGRSWTYFACNEILPTKMANAMLAKAGARRDGGPGNNVVITSSNGETSTVWFYPDHPACCFRAYDSLDEGAVDYLALLHRRFASAWPAVIEGDPGKYSRLLKAARYYTADEDHYTRSVTSLFLEFQKRLTRV